MLFLRSTGAPHLLGSFHEKWKDGSQTKDVHKLMAVVSSLRSYHPMIQNLEGASSGHFLLPALNTEHYCHQMEQQVDNLSLKMSIFGCCFFLAYICVEWKSSQNESKHTHVIHMIIIAAARFER